MAVADRTYTWQEVDRMLESGDVKGKLSKADLPTPALIVDLGAFEWNVKKMVDYVQSKGRSFRPHAKTHKCSHIAKVLLEAGAVGVCAAKISEAWALAEGGAKGLLVTTAVIGATKIQRGIDLARRRPETMFCVDDAQNVRDWNDAAAAAGITVNVAIDLFVGNRTGILPGDAAIALAELIDKQPNLRLAGLQAYCGFAAHTIGFDERKRVSIEAMTPAVETRRALEAKGIACPLLTGGSTGTYNIDTDLDGMNELQPGSFIFMDVDYNRIGAQSGDAFYGDFRNALFVTTTVVSKPKEEQPVVDAGLKSFSTDKPFPPYWRGGDGLTFQFAGDEHGRLMKPARAVSVGDRLDFVIPHCDPTVNLYDRMYAVRGEQVEAVWRIDARGRAQ